MKRQFCKVVSAEIKTSLTGISYWDVTTECGRKVHTQRKAYPGVGRTDPPTRVQCNCKG